MLAERVGGGVGSTGLSLIHFVFLHCALPDCTRNTFHNILLGGAAVEILHCALCNSWNIKVYNFVKIACFGVGRVLASLLDKQVPGLVNFSLSFISLALFAQTQAVSEVTGSLVIKALRGASVQAFEFSVTGIPISGIDNGRRRETNGLAQRNRSKGLSVNGSDLGGGKQDVGSWSLAAP